MLNPHSVKKTRITVASGIKISLSIVTGNSENSLSSLRLTVDESRELENGR